MTAMFAPKTAVIVQAKAGNGEIQVISMNDLYQKGPTEYRIWSAFGWTDIRVMTKVQNAVRMQWMQSRENLIVGHAAAMQVVCDPNRRTSLSAALNTVLLPEVISIVWEFARATWLLGSLPDEWFRCPLPRCMTPSRVPDDEPLLLVCHSCIEGHGFKYHKVTIDSDYYYHDPKTGHRFCEFSDIPHLPPESPDGTVECAPLDPSNWVRRRNFDVMRSDVLNHPSPARYLDEWSRWGPWTNSCWLSAEVQADVVIVARAGRHHSITEGPESYPHFQFHDTTLTTHETDGHDVLRRWDKGSRYAFQEAIFMPDHSYGIQSLSGSFCAGIGFWAFAC